MFELAFVSGLKVGGLLFLIKERGEILQCLIRPIAKKVRMNFMLASRLRERLFTGAYIFFIVVILTDFNHIPLSKFRGPL